MAFDAGDGGPCEISLFTGAGGGVLGGTILGWRTICGVEWNPFCREIIFRRQEDGMLPLFPVWDDVRSFSTGNPGSGPFIDAACRLARRHPTVVSGGFPCQPFSCARTRWKHGADDKRNMWFDTARIIREVEPDVAFLENVPRILRFNYFGEVLGDLADAGYDVWWDVVSAASCGAPHLRKRLWILAVKRNTGMVAKRQEFVGMCQDEILADSDSLRHDSVCNRSKEQLPRVGVDGIKITEHSRGPCKQETFGQRRVLFDGGIGSDGRQQGWWSRDPADGGNGDPWGIEPGLGRVVDGMADWVDRVKAISNGQVAIVVVVSFVKLAMRAGLDLSVWAPRLFGSGYNKRAKQGRTSGAGQSC